MAFQGLTANGLRLGDMRSSFAFPGMDFTSLLSFYTFGYELNPKRRLLNAFHELDTDTSDSDKKAIFLY
jgi:hypothetical protein